jgi:hypothetical protein
MQNSVVSGERAKSWFYRCCIGGKERGHGVGFFRDVSPKRVLAGCE